MNQTPHQPPPPPPPPPQPRSATDPQRYDEALRGLHRLWEQIQANLENYQRKHEEAQRHSDELLRCHRDSQRRVENLKILVDGGRRLADEVRSMEDVVRSNFYKSFNSIVGKSGNSVKSPESEPPPPLSLSPEDEESDGDKSKDSVSIESSATDSEDLGLKERSGDADVVDSDAALAETLTLGFAVDEVESQKPPSPPPPPAAAAADKEDEMSLGCRFQPTDQELISCLRRRITGEKTLKFITERDLYGSEEPKDIFRNNPAAELYFFTPIKTKFDSGKKVDRIVGNGTWKIQGTKDIYDDPVAKNEVIGHKRTLNFMDELTKTKSGNSWIMHEYILKEGPSNDQVRLALCRVKRGRGNRWGLESTSVSPPLPVSLKRPLETDANLELDITTKKVSRASDVELDVPSKSIGGALNVGKIAPVSDVELDMPSKKTAGPSDLELDMAKNRFDRASDGLLQLASALESELPSTATPKTAREGSLEKNIDHDPHRPSILRKPCIKFL